MRLRTRNISTIKRCILIAAAILSILAAPAGALAANAGRPAIILNGVALQAVPYVDSGDLYLPLRAIGEALGYQIGWSDNDRLVSVFKPGQNVTIDLKNGQITADGHSCYMSGDYPGLGSDDGTIVGDRTYMGAGFFSENFGLKVDWDQQSGRVVLEGVKENAISITTVKEASENDQIKITLQYPQIGGLADQAVQDSINSVFKQAAMDARSEGLQNAAGLAQEKAEVPSNPNKCETYFDYRLEYNQNGLLSVVLLDYQYAGGANGTTVQSACTVNLKTGAELGLKDLMRGGADYESFINNEVGKEINDRVKAGMLDIIEPFTGIDEQNFFLTDEAVVFYFQEYEHFPHSDGIQEFPVEYAELGGLLSPDISF